MRLFNKEHPHLCEYCAWADRSAREEMLCYYRGPVAADYHCRKFRYDPYKRTPNQQPAIRPFTWNETANEAADEPTDEPTQTD